MIIGTTLLFCIEIRSEMEIEMKSISRMREKERKTTGTVKEKKEMYLIIQDNNYPFLHFHNPTNAFHKHERRLHWNRHYIPFPIKSS